MENMIETKDVIQSFPIAGGKELVVLKNINIQIPTGKLTMLRGRSGSGKTTLMNLLSALDYPKSGEILFEGKPIQNLPEHDREQMRKTQIGFVFQSVALIPMMTAYENVEFVLRLAGYKGDRRKRTEVCIICHRNFPVVSSSEWRLHVRLHTSQRLFLPMSRRRSLTVTQGFR